MSLSFLIFPTVNNAYWLLSDLTAQLALIYYITLFLSAIRLRYKTTERPQNAYWIPGGKIGIWLVSGLGLLSCFAGLIISFMLPATVKTGHVFTYEATLIIGIIIFALPPLLMSKNK